ncbi:hypothetical protein [Dyadobacter psychrotolerans]|uniref:DUF4105 domain-containing protein n=1 Tax=Dyadobacter psychrotolerans TaxID=2541721 RepID=A0A4R5DCA9_9BACT|nr:hypothetical protein [Dyadobacter psychrotolerans]TDE11366.1 hypothetical protein E0F88_26005 [Dyadobacter psychrotolerans]
MLLGPKNPIDPSQKLECFGTVPSDRKYKYSITLYVDQPYANTRKIANFNPFQDPQRRAGHTYFGLERNDSNSGETIRVVMGFYVQSELTAVTGVYTGGAWGDDGGTDYDVSLTINDITASDFKDIIYRLKSPVVPQYHLADMYCTTLACDLFLPYEVLPLGRGQIGPLGSGQNPADLGQDLRERASQYGSRLTTGDNLKSPSTTNCN